MEVIIGEEQIAVILNHLRDKITNHDVFIKIALIVRKTDSRLF